MSDLIDRDKVIEYCLKLIDVERKQGSDVMNYGQERINQTDTIIAFVENLPSARPKGKWIKRHGVVNCSNCNHSHWSDCYEDTVMSFNFCPNCGARMKGADDE